MCFKLNLLRTDSGTYPGRLGDWYTCLSTQNLAPKKHFSCFVFSIVIQWKICGICHQRFHNASYYFEMAQKTKMQTKEKNNETKRRRSGRRNCLQKCFLLFKTYYNMKMFAFSSWFLYEFLEHLKAQVLKNFLLGTNQWRLRMVRYLLVCPKNLRIHQWIHAAKDIWMIIG